MQYRKDKKEMISRFSVMDVCDLRKKEPESI